MKIKSKVKNNQLIVKVKVTTSEELSEREISILSAKSIRGILKPNQVKKNIIEYTGPAGIALTDYLKRKITKYEFFFFMAQIVDATKKLRANKLFLNNLILDLRYVYVNEITKEMQFLYIPMVSNHVCLDIIGFMEAIIYSLNIDEEASKSIVRFSDFMRLQTSFDPQVIEKVISAEDSDVAKQIKRYNNCSPSGFITDKQREYYDHYGKKYDDEATGLLEDEATGLLEDEATGLLEDEATELLEDEETGLLDEDEATGLLNDNYDNHYPVHYATLTRVLNNEIIELNKPVFRLGKEKSYVDYFVDNNSAISRSHADIITRGNRYFVYDHNSTNRTYISDEMLPVKVEVEIFDGNTLKLANEEFIFHI